MAEPLAATRSSAWRSPRSNDRADRRSNRRAGRRPLRTGGCAATRPASCSRTVTRWRGDATSVRRAGGESIAGIARRSARHTRRVRDFCSASHSSSTACGWSRTLPELLEFPDLRSQRRLWGSLGNHATLRPWRSPCSSATRAHVGDRPGRRPPRIRLLARVTKLTDLRPGRGRPWARGGERRADPAGRTCARCSTSSGRCSSSWAVALDAPRRRRRTSSSSCAPWDDVTPSPLHVSA